MTRGLTGAVPDTPDPKGTARSVPLRRIIRGRRTVGALCSPSVQGTTLAKHCPNMRTAGVTAHDLGSRS